MYKTEHARLFIAVLGALSLLPAAAAAAAAAAAHGLQPNGAGEHHNPLLAGSAPKVNGVFVDGEKDKTKTQPHQADAHEAT
jgi:hypothetical protein